MSRTPSVQGSQGNYQPTQQKVNDNPTVETPKGKKMTLTPHRDSVMTEDTIKGGKDLTSATTTKPRIISFIDKGVTKLSKGIQHLLKGARETAIRWGLNIKDAPPSIFEYVRDNLRAATTRDAKEIHSETCFKAPEIIETKVEVGDTSLKSTCTPQASLSGFSDGVKFYGSELGSKEHISNLWRHDIEVGSKSVSFIRSGSTRGNEQATKELLANAVALQYDINKLPNDATVTLNLSNIQLMTPVGKIGDGGIPLKQMEKLQELAKSEPVEVHYGDKKLKVNLNPPLLFNFGVNVQNFRMGKLAHSKEIDAINQKSFRRLFGGDPKVLPEDKIAEDGSLIWDFITNPKTKNDLSRKHQVEEVEALAGQIKTILQKHPNGIESNPYALPVRVMLLTNLLGYATTYNCRSGKDRTGVCAMELESLAAKTLSTNEPYDPEKPTEEEKAVLQQLYSKSEAITIAQYNEDQKGLTIEEMLGFNSLQERFGVKLKRDFSSNLNKLYVNKGNKLYEELSKKMKELKPLSDKLKDADNQIGKLARGERSSKSAETIAKEINEGKYGEQVRTAFNKAKQEDSPHRTKEWEESAKLADISKALYEGLKEVKQLETIRSQVALLIEGAKKPHTMNSEKLLDIQDTLGKLLDTKDTLGKQQEDLAKKALEYLKNFPRDLLGNTPTPPPASSLEISEEKVKEILAQEERLIAKTQKSIDLPSGQDQILDESPTLPLSSETSTVQPAQTSPVSTAPKPVKALNKIEENLARILNEANELGVSIHVTREQSDKEGIPSELVAQTQAGPLASEALPLSELEQPIQESNEKLVKFLGKLETADYLDQYTMHDLRMMFMSVNTDKKTVDNFNEGDYKKLDKKIKSLTDLSKRLNDVDKQIKKLVPEQGRGNDGGIITELANFSEVSKAAKSKIDNRLEKMNYILSEVKWLKEYAAESSVVQKKTKRLEKKSEWLNAAYDKIKGVRLLQPRDEKLEQDTFNEIYGELTTIQAWEPVEGGMRTNPLKIYQQQLPSPLKPTDKIDERLKNMQTFLAVAQAAFNNTLKERK